MYNLCPKFTNRNREQIWGIYGKRGNEMNRQRALYEYLLNKGDEWTSQAQVARDLYEYYGNGECCLMPENFHDTHERLILSRDISDMAFSKDYEKIIISSGKGIKIANEEEFDRYIKSQFKSAIRRLAKVYAMSKKGNLNGQIDFGGHTVESFLENLPETP
jgi:AAA15 family ATPase/GTPase